MSSPRRSARLQERQSSSSYEEEEEDKEATPERQMSRRQKPVGMQGVTSVIKKYEEISRRNNLRQCDDLSDSEESEEEEETAADRALANNPNDEVLDFADMTSDEEVEDAPSFSNTDIYSPDDDGPNLSRSRPEIAVRIRDARRRKLFAPTEREREGSAEEQRNFHDDPTRLLPIEEDDDNIPSTSSRPRRRKNVIVSDEEEEGEKEAAPRTVTPPSQSIVPVGASRSAPRIRAYAPNDDSEDDDLATSCMKRARRQLDMDVENNMKTPLRRHRSLGTQPTPMSALLSNAVLPKPPLVKLKPPKKGVGALIDQVSAFYKTLGSDISSFDIGIASDLQAARAEVILRRDITDAMLFHCPITISTYEDVTNVVEEVRDWVTPLGKKFTVGMVDYHAKMTKGVLYIAMCKTTLW